MSRDTWYLKRTSRRFNVSIYRWVGTAILFSLALNVILSLVVSHIYFNRPDYVYYSTNGVTKPMPLHALMAPNQSSVPLLASDPVTDDVPKQAPE